MASAEEFIGKNVQAEFVQEVGWRRPTTLRFDDKSYKVQKVLSRWEEHTFGEPWWQRKHRVWYEIKLDDGHRYQLYWDRGARGEGNDWFLVKRVS